MKAVSMKSGVWKRNSTFGRSIEKFRKILVRGKSFAFSVTKFANNFNEFC